MRRGGIGKTVVASWLVRHDNVRQQFDAIIWVTLGQTPQALNVQQSAFQQLTGGRFSGDESDEERKIALHQAMQKTKVLLVLDDCWENAHEKLLNVVDESCGSKVLLSSRVRQVLNGTGANQSRAAASDSPGAPVIVNLQLPSEADGIRMLLSTADLPINGQPPAQALELVQFCKLLPLSISIAGKLVKEFGVGEADDWDGIVELMKEEFAESGDVAEAVISASIHSIHGSQKQNVMHLFKALALLPEDTMCPLEVVSLMCQAVPAEDGGKVKRPNVLNTRRWLKQLIDRSLVLGSVDRPVLHDIVADFVHSQHSEAELQVAHRALVDLFRAARPIDAATNAPAWNNAGNTPISRYVRYICGEHVQRAWRKPDWEHDEHAIAWLVDFPQDDIVVAASVVLGVQKMTQLVANAEAKGGDTDRFRLAKLAALASGCVRREEGGRNALVMGRKALDVLGAGVEDNSVSEHREDEERLELKLINTVMLGSDPADFKYLPRLEYLVTTDAADSMIVEKCYAFYFKANPLLIMGQLENFAEAFMSFPETTSQVCCTHPDEHARTFALIVLATCAVYEVVLSQNSTKARWDWDRLFGQNGSLLKEFSSKYNYDVHHSKVVEICFGLDVPISVGMSSVWLAYHFGDLVAANQWMDQSMELFQQKIFPSQDVSLNAHTWVCLFCWAPYAHDMGRSEQLSRTFAQGQITWNEGDKTADDKCAHIAIFRPRGDTTMGMHIATTEHIAWMFKLSYLLVTPDRDIPTHEIMAQLPSMEEIIVIVNAGLPHSWSQAAMAQFNLVVLLAEVCEKLGEHERALLYAEQAVINSDITRGGSTLPSVKVRGNRVKGRCLSKQDKMEEAAAAFEAASSTAADAGLGLLEVLSLRDLKLHVLDEQDGHGHGTEGTARLKTAICQLMGAGSSDPEQLAMLASALGTRIDLPSTLG